MAVPITFHTLLDPLQEGEGPLSICSSKRMKEKLTLMLSASLETVQIPFT